MSRAASLRFVLPLALVLVGQSAPAQTRDVTVTEGFRNPAVAPDGTRLAFALHGHIWTVPIAGGAARQLTSGTGWDTHPAWSPDGRFVAYVHQRPNGAELVVHALETGNERTVYATEGGRVIGQIAWRPNAAELVFVLETHQYMAHLWSVSLRADSKAKSITEGSATEWTFGLSPDGSRAAVESVLRGPRDLFLVTLSNGESHRLTDTPAEEFSAQWSRDGNSLIYLTRDNGIERVTVRNLSTNATRTAFESPLDGKELALGADGSTLVMAAGRQLVRLDLGSGRTTPIPITARLTLPAQAPGNVLIANVRLWDGTGAPVRDGAWVAVRNGRIAAVGQGALTRADSAGLTVIDGRGRFLLPGLMDNHYHYWRQWVFDAPRRIAMGVTAGRDPGTELADALSLREAIRLGVIDGPDMFTTGPVIDGPCGAHPAVDVILDRADAAAPLVRALKNQGVDAIKVYHCLKPDIVRAAVAEARRLGLPVTGDLGGLTHWDQAVDAGITGLNHVYTYIGAYLPPEYQVFRDGDVPQLWVARWRLSGNVPVDPNRPEVDSVFARMVRTNVAFDPTLHIFNVADSTRRSLGVEEGERAMSRWHMMQTFVKKSVDAGVMLLAGTDALNLNDELEEYETAGVPRDIILKSATVNGAKWLGKAAEFGTIEPGRLGHLLLVDGDPLKQIKDLRNVILVTKAGRIAYRQD